MCLSVHGTMCVCADYLWTKQCAWTEQCACMKTLRFTIPLSHTITSTSTWINLL